MGECLWLEFYEERVKNVNVVLATIGAYGLLEEFQHWLEANAEFKDGKLQRREENAE